MNRKLEFTVPEEYEGKKAFYFLRGCAGISARALSSLKRVDGGITRGGETLRTIDRLHAGDIVTVTLPVETETVEPMDINIDVIYEDADLLAVNKSPFLAMHPTHNHQGDTLANAVAGHLQSEGKSAVFRCVGRLDKGTSGVVVCALNRYAAARLSGNISKKYIAVVRGRFEGSGTINKPIYRPDPMKTLRACGDMPGSESAVTHWESLYSSDEYSLLSLTLETGRTHQIRVHFASMGAPLAGDTMYGEEFFEILTLKSLGRIDRPIVLYNINGYYDSMRALLEYTAGEKFMARDVVDMCRFMKDPEEILDYIENYRNYGGKL